MKKKITLFPMQLFNVVNTMFLRKFFFLAHKNLKKTPSKAANNQPKPFISQSSPAYSPELIFHIIKCREQASVLLVVTCGSYVVFFYSTKKMVNRRIRNTT